MKVNKHLRNKSNDYYMKNKIEKWFVGSLNNGVFLNNLSETLHIMLKWIFKVLYW